MVYMRYDTDKNAYVFDKDEKSKINDYFNTSEFRCPCKNDSCKVQTINKLLIDQLTEVRIEYNQPINCNSGYRCHAHQLELAANGKETATGISQHELGKAADIRGNDMAVLQSLCEKKFKALGVARSFLHVDTRSDRIRRWSYILE